MSTDAGPGIDGLSRFRRIGSGGFSTVYAAWEDDFSRWVAVKVLHDLDDGAVRRFERERSLMGQSSGHPNVTTPIRSGLTAEGNPYLVMQYMEGGSLQDVVDRGQVLPWRDAVALIRPVADALGDSHDQGIVHKDVKPANILIARNGSATLTDFGIAGLRGAEATRMAYTFSHSPPETFAGGTDQRDARSDLYSLASTLYTVVAGRTPFESDADDSELAWMTRIATHPVPLLGVDPHLDRFFDIALAKDPDDRPQTAAAFIDGLDRVAAGRLAAPETVVAAGARARAVETRAADPGHPRPLLDAVGVDPAGGTPRPSAGRGGSGIVGWLVAGVGLLALAGAVWFAFLRDTADLAGTAATDDSTAEDTEVAAPVTEEPTETSGDGDETDPAPAADQVQQALTLFQNPDSHVRTLLTGGLLPVSDVSDGGFTFSNCESQLIGLLTGFGGAELPQLRSEIDRWPTGAPEGYDDAAGADRGFQERLDAYVDQTETGYRACGDDADIRPVGTHVLSGFASIQSFFCVTGVVEIVSLADGSSQPCPGIDGGIDEQALCVEILNPLLSDFFLAFPTSQPDATAACAAAIADDEALFAQL